MGTEPDPMLDDCECSSLAGKTIELVKDFDVRKPCYSYDEIKLNNDGTFIYIMKIYDVDTVRHIDILANNKGTYDIKDHPTDNDLCRIKFFDMEISSDDYEMIGDMCNDFVLSPALASLVLANYFTDNYVNIENYDCKSFSTDGGAFRYTVSN